MCVVKKRGRGGDGLPEFCVEVALLFDHISLNVQSLQCNCHRFLVTSLWTAGCAVLRL